MTRLKYFIRLLLAALTRSGCPLSESNAWRHLVCEECSPAVEGGFDAENNQVVICQKRVVDDDRAEAVLTHELVHMYDFCTAKVDFNNVRHLACTEVRFDLYKNYRKSHFMCIFYDTGRAANLSQRCRFSALGSRLSARAHRECVRELAAGSVASIKQELSRDEARSAVDEVFDRCYADLEPIGRHSWGDRY